ncbi:MAG: DUF3857 domain-containing protein [Acidobacteria bacterium]|nr:DUF3857 domain-containing protein [Acidobacteriota bacterium]
MNRRILTLTLWIAAAWLAAAPTTTAPVADSPGAAYETALKAADAEVLLREKTFTLNPDGSWETRVHEVRKVLTLQGMNRALGETVIPFRDGWQTVEVGEAFTTRPDGTKVPLPANARIEIMNLHVARNPAFSDLRSLVVAHTGLEIGAVTDLSWTVRTRKGFLPFFEGMEMLAGPFPVRDQSVVVRVPRGTPLKTAGSGGGMAFTRTAASGQDVFTWRGRGTLPVFTERVAPEAACWAPWVSFTTAPSDAAVLKALATEPLTAELFEEVTGRKAGAMAGLPGLADARAVLEKALEGVRTVDAAPAETGAWAAPPREVWDRACGTRLEKARLAAAALAACGAADTGVALLLPSAGGVEPVPGLLAASAFLARFRTTAGTFCADTDGFVFTADDPRWQGMVLVEPDGKRRKPAVAEGEAGCAWSLSLEAKDWKDKTCRLSGRLALRGTAVDTPRLLDDAAKYAESTLGEALKPYGVKGLKVTVNLAAPNLLEAGFEADAEKLFEPGEERALALPIPPPVAAWKGLLPVATGRTAPPALFTPAEFRLDLSVALPPKGKVAAGPKTAAWERDGVKWSQEARLDGETWRFTRTTRLPSRDVPLQTVADALAGWLADTLNRLVLE